MTVNTYWEKEEFEDSVAHSLIAMYENKINKKCKKVPTFIRPTEKDILAIKKLGCYFPPADRIVLEGNLDTLNDGFIKEASWALKPGSYSDCGIEGEYFRLGYMRLLDNIPKGILNYKKIGYFGNHKIYKILYFSATNKNGLHVQKSFVSIDPFGNIYDCYGINSNTNKPQLLASATGIDNNLTTDVGYASAILGYYSDRRFLWNVTGIEKAAKATFGVYPEQIKSLFYARELPMTETGRKRPILHWVASHQRRIKNGIDIDIEKHLRGVNEFIYQGTKFIISRPIKVTN